MMRLIGQMYNPDTGPTRRFHALCFAVATATLALSWAQSRYETRASAQELRREAAIHARTDYRPHGHVIRVVHPKGTYAASYWAGYPWKGEQRANFEVRGSEIR